jgi:hypothetical protein
VGFGIPHIVCHLAAVAVAKLRSTAENRIIKGCAFFRLCAGAHNRKNWLHVWSVEAGPRVAAILSVVETCRRLGIPVREYLAEVLPGLADRKASELGALTPMA